MGTPISSYVHKYKIILFFLAFVVLIPNKALAEEKIDNFFNNVTVEKDGTITVREIYIMISEIIKNMGLLEKYLLLKPMKMEKDIKWRFMVLVFLMKRMIV